MKHIEVKQVMGSLIDSLNECNSRLEIKVDESAHGCLEAANMEYSNNFRIGLVFIHDKGEIEYAADLPTRREYLVENMSGFDDKGWAKLTYEEKKLVLSDHWVYESESWFKSNDNQEIDESADTEERLNQWLEVEMEDDGDGDVDAYLCRNHRITESLPGSEIHDCLSEAERAEIGIRETDLGGPASGEVLAVLVRDADKLEELIFKYDLPFYFKSQVKS